MEKVTDIKEEDCWALDETLSRLILPRLQKYYEINTHGYPHELNSHEEWKEIVKKMIYSFDVIANDKYISTKEKNYIKLMIEQNKKVQEGLDLFAKYFNSLWD